MSKRMMHYDGLKDGGTFPLDAATAAKIKDNPKSLIHKALTWVDGTGEPMVGYGQSAPGGSPIAGIVVSIDKCDAYVDGTQAGDWTVGISWRGTFIDIPTPNANTGVAAKWLNCDDKGNVVTSATITNTACLSVDTVPAQKTCIVKID